MKIYMERPAVQQELVYVRCNLCGVDIERDMAGYFEDYVSIVKNWGYNSPYDGEVHSIDLCQNCYQSWVSKFIIAPQVEYAEYVWK